MSSRTKFSDEYIRHIFAEIAQGRGAEGDFLRSFAQAMVRADPGDFSLLRASAFGVIAKYDLAKYLDNFK